MLSAAVAAQPSRHDNTPGVRRRPQIPGRCPGRGRAARRQGAAVLLAGHAYKVDPVRVDDLGGNLRALACSSSHAGTWHHGLSPGSCERSFEPLRTLHLSMPTHSPTVGPPFDCGTTWSYVSSVCSSLRGSTGTRTRRAGRRCASSNGVREPRLLDWYSLSTTILGMIEGDLIVCCTRR